MLSHEELAKLIETSEEPHVSLFLPTERAGREVRQNPIRLRNLLDEAQRRLIAGGLRPPEAEAILAPALRLLDDDAFWLFQSDGLALFLTPEDFYEYRLPLAFQELVVVNSHRFHLKPILSTLKDKTWFYILALSQSQVSLLKANRFSVSEVKAPDLPAGMEDVLKYDESERVLGFHTTVPTGRGGEREAVFHIHGGGTEDRTEDFLRYFRQIDSALHDVLRNEKAPLVTASVDYLMPLYQQVNTYKNLVKEGVTGNPERVKAEDLRDKAWAVVEPHFRQRQQEAEERYRELAGTGLTSSDIRSIIPAAYYGQIDVLFVALDVEMWGRFRPETGEVELQDEPQQGAEDLLDFAAVHTWLNGGLVYAFDRSELPVGAAAAAILRYAVKPSSETARPER